ncbi:hypothetical protein QF044_003025 [Chryseobacterium sp. W4I1]|nr:hypothetical protein [Chryseobacterium sp. W4I1]
MNLSLVSEKNSQIIKKKSIKIGNNNNSNTSLPFKYIANLNLEIDSLAIY